MRSVPLPIPSCWLIATHTPKMHIPVTDISVHLCLRFPCPISAALQLLQLRLRFIALLAGLCALPLGFGCGCQRQRALQATHALEGLGWGKGGAADLAAFLLHLLPLNAKPSQRCKMNRKGGIDMAEHERPRKCEHSKHTRLLSCGSRSLFNICSANRSESLKPSFAKTASRLINR